ncbi:class A beta-lactamase [Caulobacter sp. KR2-114]|uniref:class A beta-lactamase n=1 Tax=Caulobacter sp. KR2-114 TaxID=3400912 RepID=UPI003C095E24
MRRRDLLGAAPAFAVAPAALRHGMMPAGDPVRARLAELEHRIGGRLGLSVLDTGSGRRIGWRSGERFAMCSTFKLMLAAAVLKRVDAGAERLDRQIAYGPRDLQPYAPTAKAHVAEGRLSVEALCEAAVTLSDNTAANLLLHSLGGPAGYTRYLRRLGDPTTRLDRTEPTLNTAIAGDVRDTTTPDAMLGDMRTVLLGEALSPASRQRLVGWMRACQTAGARIRAGLPAGWSAGDKTGTGDNGSTNTLSILWPPGGRPPILAALYCQGSTQPRPAIEAVHADVGRLIAAMA